MKKIKVLVTRKWPKSVEEKLLNFFDTKLNVDDIPLSEEELILAMQEYDALLPTVTDKINDKIIGCENRKVKIIGNFGVGFNNIDIESAKRNKIVVTNTPEVLTDCTADIAMLLMLGIARRASEGELHVRNKVWTGWCPTHMLSTKVTGKKLGFIGFGRIAQAVAQKAHFGFGMEVSFYDPYPPSDEIIKKFSAKKFDTLEDVLKNSDYVTLHCPGGGDNTNLMNKERFALMKKSAFLINTARGDVVDEAALVQALKDDVIAGAGLDVYEKEPLPENNKLRFLPNVLLTPHIGYVTAENYQIYYNQMIESLEACVNGKPIRVIE
jgi:lactate dehydrogenase-like 2-hydroxyacid dehydrogenase